AASGFFALRTPLLPWKTLEELGESLEASRAPHDDRAIQVDRARINERLRTFVGADVREAIFVASPSLHDAVDAWLADTSDARAEGVIDILMRYVARMAGRATPFGLFSGCSAGRIGPETRLELPSRRAYRRHTRLDTHYLAALCDALHRDVAVRGALVYRP